LIGDPFAERNPIGKTDAVRDADNSPMPSDTTRRAAVIVATGAERFVRGNFGEGWAARKVRNQIVQGRQYL
jgi:hypothetical protein